MEIIGYWKIVRKRLWLIVLLLLIGGAGAVYYNRQVVPQYRTTTTLFLNPGVSSPLLPYQSSRTVQSLANTYIEFMRTRTFARMVADEAGLAIPAQTVLSALATQYVADTQFFRITAIHHDPQIAQLIANASARVLIAENVARQQAVQEQITAQQNLNPELQLLSDLRTSLQQELAMYENRINTTQSQISDLELRAQSDWNNQRLASLRQQLLSLQSSRANVLSSLTQAQSSLVASNPDITSMNMDTAVVVDEAPLPLEPLPLQTLQRMLMMLAVALAIGVGLAVLLEYVDYTVKTPEELDAVYGAAALGVLGVAGHKAGKARSKAQLIMLSDPFAPIAEAFRSLRTSIGFSALTTPIRSLIITSAGPGEGKTFVAANLAVTLAQSGKRVVLVDTDLRKPQQHHMFDLEREPGLTNLMLDPQAELVDFLQDTAISNLQVLTSGTLPPNPADLLGSPRAVQVMEQLEDYADIVIYDSPPAATVTDAAIVAQHVNAVLQVVQAGKTRVDLLLRCKAVLEQVGARVVGPVLNRVGGRDLGYYAYYYTYSYYGKQGQNGQNGQHRQNGQNGQNEQNGHTPVPQRRLRRLPPRDQPAEPAVPPYDRPERPEA